jgi:hypothetical protein
MDLRVENIYQEEMKEDKSFQEKPTALELLFGFNYKHRAKLKETWRLGIKHGIEIGLRKASLEGQKIESYQNVKDQRQREFLDKFYSLSEEYGCVIQYHPELGMVVIDRN